MTEWATLLAMLLGAGIAMALSLLVEACRDHRELGREARRPTYDITSGRRQEAAAVPDGATVDPDDQRSGTNLARSE
jgi:hypothetical protein